jgi:hypothetical protein
MTVYVSPVDSYDRGITQFRSVVRERLPFTFIAYRSLIPEKDDDWYYLAEKVAWFVFVIFNLVDFLLRSSSPIFIFIPFVPLVLDGIWTVNRWLGRSENSFSSAKAGWFNSIQIIGFVAFSATGVFFLMNKVRPT